LEQILAARYEYDYAARNEKAAREKELFDLVDKAIAGTSVSRNELLHVIQDRYLQFKREKQKLEKVTIAQKLQP
jgi:hypothetical protein